MGPNGAGKSTILKTIFGLVPCDHGEILWEGQKIIPRPHEVVNLGIAFVPQGRRVFQHLTVEENLDIGAYTVRNSRLTRQRKQEVFSIFPVLKSRRKTKSGELSGGQQQMLAIARGLMVDPKLLLLDEPSLGLAPKVVKEVFEIIKQINARKKTAIAIVEHNLKSLLEIVDRAYVLDKGQIVKTDSGQAIIKSDILEKVFLGKPLS
jgi:branched-chain amino acid transport system ATP-binding protein